ncbi:MAG: GreA/GreB family elongation factor [Chloroflexota bacterium]
MEKEEWTLGQAATAFLASLPPDERKAAQQEVNKFIRWYGMERTIRGLAAQEVASYAERMDASSANVQKRLEPVRAFLSYAKKEGLTPTNLSVHLRAKKSTPKRKQRRAGKVERLNLTRQGYEEMRAELATLQAERRSIVDDISRAAADKDFRENAPLDAARDRQAIVEGRIRQLEAILQSAVVTSEQAETAGASRGSTVVLQALPSGEQVRYTLVDPREASPTRGKLSVTSPTGKALLGKRTGEVIEVAAPAGTLTYRIETIEG